MNNLVLPETLRTDADEFMKAGSAFLQGKRDIAVAESKELPHAAFLVLSGLVSLGEGTAYDAFKTWRDLRPPHDGKRLVLPLPSAYRAAAWLAKEGLIDEVRKEDSATNSIQRTVYRVNDDGIQAWAAEGLHLVQIALSWLPCQAGSHE